MSLQKACRWAFTLSAFTGSFLLFFIQPLVGKELLPFAGGSFMVWAVALAFFQLVLLSGYLVVHFVFGVVVSKWRIACYLVVVAICLFLRLPATDLSAPGENFVTWVLWSLTSLVGMPLLALATGQLTLQRWWQRATKESPDFIFSASNAGSLTGLLIFPILIEPHFESPQIWAGWYVGNYVWWLGMAVSAILAKISVPAEKHEIPDGFKELAALIEKTNYKDLSHHSFLDHALPAMAGSALLSATTNVMTMDIAGFPLLWVIPLALYLITWILAFADQPPDLTWWEQYFPDLLTAAFALYLITQLGFTLEASIKCLCFLFILYRLAIFCHTAVRLRRPHDPARLTGYYLALSVGGAAGSMFVSLLAPNIFSGLGEYPLALFLVVRSLCCNHSDQANGRSYHYSSTISSFLRSIVGLWSHEASDPFLPIRVFGLILIVGILPALFNRGMPETGAFLISSTVGAMIYIAHSLRYAARRGYAFAFMVLITAICLIGIDKWGTSGILRESFRNYYGLYKVYDSDMTRILQMGSTIHGNESLDSQKRGQPLYYYHPKTPIGIFFSRRPSTWMRMGVVGLGAGTLAAYGVAGQEIEFFELDPDGLKLARRWFSYLLSSTASVSIKVGDGRLALRTKPSNSFDLIVLDAFSSDAIPIHLLTVEAISEYLRVLRSDGVLLFHISNRHFDLRRVLTGAAARLGLQVRYAENSDSDDPLIYPTRWVAMGYADGIEKHIDGLEGWLPLSTVMPLEPWTDHYSSVWSILGSVREFRIPSKQ